MFDFCGDEPGMLHRPTDSQARQSRLQKQITRLMIDFRQPQLLTQLPQFQVDTFDNRDKETHC